MNQTDCKYLAKLNRKAHRGTMIKTQIFLTISTILFIIFIGIISCLKGSYSQLTNSNQSLRFIDYFAKTAEDANAFRDFAKQQKEVTSVTVSAVSVMEPPDLEMDSLEQIQMSVEDCFLVIDGGMSVGETQETGREIFTHMNFGFIPVYLESFWADDLSSFQLIPDCNREEFEQKTGSDNVFLVGSEFNSKKQIIMSEYMLTCFGYSPDAQKQLIGKKVSFGMIYDDQHYVCIEDYTLQGILKTEYFGLSNLGELFPQIWIIYDENETKLSYRYDVGGVVNNGFIATAYLDDFDNMENAMNRFKDAGFPSDPGVSQLITIWLYDGMLLLKKIVLFVIVFFVCIMMISICNSLYFYYSTMYETYDMLFKIGAKLEAVKRICLCELSAIFIRAFLVSILVSVTGLKFISKISGQFLEFKIVLNMYDYITAILISGILLTLLFFLFYFVFPNRILNQTQAKI